MSSHEVFSCLFCHVRVIGDDAWHAHLQSHDHRVNSVERLDLTREEVFETAEEKWREVAMKALK